MDFEERDYQKYATDCAVRDIAVKDCHPISAIPTGAGKTIIMGKIIQKYIKINPTHKILVISFVQEILVQDREALQRFFPDEIIGLYSAGLGSKIIRNITVAGIQSIYKKGEIFKNFDLVIVDEAHVMPPKGNGMFKQFFSKVHGTRVGLTATPFRTKQGYLHEGKGAWFNKISCDLCTINAFNYLVDKGYLTTLHAPTTNLQLDPKRVRTIAGDFNNKDLSQKFDRDEITSMAVKEVIEFGKNYKSWLIFAINIEHAENINRELQSYGIKSKALHSHTAKNRKYIIKDIKAGDLRCVVSVGMVTTGFDAPNIDLIVLLRHTKSPILHVQMIGRGLRVCKESGKTHCLVLDFAGNIKRLGAVNDVQVPGAKKKKKDGQAVVKTCPECSCMHHPTVRICNACGHVFIFKTKLQPTPGNQEIVKKNEKRIPSAWLDVTDVKYSVHRKISSPDSLKVEYICGISRIAEYVCYNHSGFAKHKADHWVNYRWTKTHIPKNVDILCDNAEYLKKPEKILVSNKSKYPVIEDFIFN